MVAFAYGGGGFYTDTYRPLYGWVPEELQQWVLAKSMRENGAPQEVDPASIRGHIPHPDTGK